MTRRRTPPEAPPAPRDGALRRGNKHGLWVERDGDSLVEQEYCEGVRHGRYRRWGPDGALREEGRWRYGGREGTFVRREPGFTVESRYASGKLEGVLRVTRDGGAVELECEYREGKVPPDGPWELVHPAPPRWVRERGAYRVGLREGPWEARYPNGALFWRAHYRAGREHGPYVRRWQTGGVWSEGECREGSRVGRWVHRRHDGTLQAEVDHADDGAVRALRWLARDGRERAPVEALDVEDLERWLALGDAWDDAVDGGQGAYPVQLAVDRWPEEDRARPLAWIAERAAAGERPPRWEAGAEWFEAMLEGDGDPRVALVDAVVFDHACWDEDQVPRFLRHAPRLRTLALDECAVEPGVEALFPEGVAWSVLAELALYDCGPLDEAARRLARAPWASGLRELALGGHDEPLSREAFDAIVRAPWLGVLEVLRLDGARPLDALIARETPSLRVLDLGLGGEALTPEALLGLADPARRPRLEELVLRGVDSAPPLDALRAARPGLAVTVEPY